jgi:hypothetical protein
MVRLSWGDAEANKFLRTEWSQESFDDWDDFRCSRFKKDWECDQLIEAIQKDLDENLSFDDIKLKYLEYLK